MSEENEKARLEPPEEAQELVSEGGPEERSGTEDEHSDGGEPSGDEPDLSGFVDPDSVSLARSAPETFVEDEEQAYIPATVRKGDEEAEKPASIPIPATSIVTKLALASGLLLLTFFVLQDITDLILWSTQFHPAVTIAIGVVSGIFLLCIAQVILREIRAGRHLRRVNKAKKKGAEFRFEKDFKRCKGYLEKLSKLNRTPAFQARWATALSELEQFPERSSFIFIRVYEGVYAEAKLEAEKIITEHARTCGMLIAANQSKRLDLILVLYHNYSMFKELSCLFGYPPGFVSNMVAFKYVLANAFIVGHPETSVIGILSESFGKPIAKKLAGSIMEGTVAASLVVRAGTSAYDTLLPLPKMKIASLSTKDLLRRTTSLVVG